MFSQIRSGSLTVFYQVAIHVLTKLKFIFDPHLSILSFFFLSICFTSLFSISLLQFLSHFIFGYASRALRSPTGDWTRGRWMVGEVPAPLSSCSLHLAAGLPVPQCFPRSATRELRQRLQPQGSKYQLCDPGSQPPHLWTQKIEIINLKIHF